jgi:hypothetical protein
MEGRVRIANMGFPWMQGGTDPLVTGEMDNFHGVV